MRELICEITSFLCNEAQKEIPAIERFDGPYFKVIRKGIRQGKMNSTDILILSGKDGILKPDQMLPYRKSRGKMGDLGMSPNQTEAARARNLSLLKALIANYSEIYVNIGKSYLKLIEGFEQYTKAKVIYAKGSFGQKAAHMRDWINSE